MRIRRSWPGKLHVPSSAGSWMFKILITRSWLEFHIKSLWKRSAGSGFRKGGAVFVMAFFLSFIMGCAAIPLKNARQAFYGGDPGEALVILDDCSATDVRNRLLCHFEKGLVAFEVGDHELSMKEFLDAEEFIKTLDGISLSGEAATLLAGEWTRAYAGEYSERLWVHTYLMMNFLLMGRVEDAQVEARQALEIYDTHGEALEGAGFTRALMALCFENMELWDDARIEYDRLGQTCGSGGLAIIRLEPDKGELVLFAAQGRAPVKVQENVVLPPSIRISLPRYSGSDFIPPLEFTLDGVPIHPPVVTTNTGRVARRSLEERRAALIARQGLRAGAKEAMARAVGKESDAGEALVRILLFLLEEADTRSWETLPGGLKLIRLPMDQGIHTLKIRAADQALLLDDIEIKPGQRIYRALRFSS